MAVFEGSAFQMKKITLKIGDETGFFARGRLIANAVDRGEPLRDACILSFEDPADVARLLTTARLALFRTVKLQPGSITQIADRLQRDRSAVKRDIDALSAAGLLIVAERVLPGHGKMKEVRAAARHISLRADLS